MICLLWKWGSRHHWRVRHLTSRGNEGGITHVNTAGHKPLSDPTGQLHGICRKHS